MLSLLRPFPSSAPSDGCGQTRSAEATRSVSSQRFQFGARTQKLFFFVSGTKGFRRTKKKTQCQLREEGEVTNFLGQRVQIGWFLGIKTCPSGLPMGRSARQATLGLTCRGTCTDRERLVATSQL